MSEAVYKVGDELLMLELIEAAYLEADGFSIDVTECLYGPKANGVGCPVGCLISQEVAEEWDGVRFGNANIIDIVEARYAQYREWFEQPLLQLLNVVQNAHDTNGLNGLNVSTFLQSIGHFKRELGYGK